MARGRFVLGAREVAPEPREVLRGGVEPLASRAELAPQHLRVLAGAGGVVARRGGGLAGGGGLLAGAERLLGGLLELLAGDLDLAAQAGDGGLQLVLVGAGLAGGLVRGAGQPRGLLQAVAVRLDLGEDGARPAVDLGDPLGGLAGGAGRLLRLRDPGLGALARGGGLGVRRVEP